MGMVKKKAAALPSTQQNPFFGAGVSINTACCHPKGCTDESTSLNLIGLLTWPNIVVCDIFYATAFSRYSIYPSIGGMVRLMPGQRKTVHSGLEATSGSPQALISGEIQSLQGISHTSWCYLLFRARLDPYSYRLPQFWNRLIPQESNKTNLTHGPYKRKNQRFIFQNRNNYKYWSWFHEKYDFGSYRETANGSSHNADLEILRYVTQRRTSLTQTPMIVD